MLLYLRGVTLSHLTATRPDVHCVRGDSAGLVMARNVDVRLIV
jgi:hypothetical protein